MRRSPRDRRVVVTDPQRPTRGAFLGASVGLGLTLGGCAAQPPSSAVSHLGSNRDGVTYPATIVAADGIRVVVGRRPHRIVALALDVAEIVVALVPPPRRSRIAALPALAWNPALSNIAALAPQIGTRVRLDAESVLALRPDLVLAGSLTGDAVLGTIRAAGVPVLVVNGYRGVDDVVDHIRLVGWAIDERPRAEAAIAAMQRTIAAARERLRPDRAGMRVLYLAPRYFTAGDQTAAAAKLALAGVRNVAAEAGVVGAVPLTAEAIVAMNPDGILVRDGLEQDRGMRSRVLGDPQLATTSAVRAGRVVAVSAAAILAVSPYFGDGVRGVVDALNRL